MSSTAGSAPALHVHTRLLDDDGPLLEWTQGQHPLAFLRNGDGIVGFGGAYDAHVRLADMPALWRSVARAATVSDEVGLPGTGLVAFGSFAFSPSSFDSLLTVPAVIVGRRDGVSWITEVNGGFPVSRAPLGTRPTTTFEPGAMTPDAYRSAVATAVERITAGEASKVVLARDLVGRIDPKLTDLRALLARLAAEYPDTYTFAVDGLLGSSPETLVSVRGGTASARVLAGTAARGADAPADAQARATIAASPKDLAEHDFAVQNVLASLGSHGASFHVEGPYPLPLPNLWHLASDVSGTLTDGSSALDLVAALHPTAAVAGSPTAAALDLISELEPFDRGRYAGPVGWVDANGDGEWAIALRCARVDYDTITAYAGAGIVADSNPDRELAETDLKFRPIVEALAG